ncbi:aldehyde dehydrogenase family protein [Leifsonia poae]|uniref:aldehyde dehydrogenase family protein n=1 Tax=Leifsonia poae TaxID=110933 RepID=UPI001CBEDD6B|nr:aldehyde dehydrogenase family protein [Leifsonia poae]
MTKPTAHYIDGVWESALGRPLIEVDNPADGSLVGAVVAGDARDADRAVEAARRAFPGWAATPLAERIALIERMAAGIERERDRLAGLLSAEMGAPIGFARAAQVGVALADLAALAAAARDHEHATAVSNSLVVSEPAGVVVAITPWNFPLHQIVLKVGGALLAGCTVVLKPSEIAPLNAAALARILHDAGAPPGVVNVVFGDGAGVGEPLAAHPGVDLVTFTGSRAVGERIAVVAAANITRVALELGGKSAAIVLDDASVADSVAGVLRSCFANSGQTCAALTRVLVPASMLDEWTRAAVAASADWQPGDPGVEGTAIGPLASQTQLQRVRDHIAAAIDDGAELLAGGLDAPSGLAGGAYVRPTIFGGVTPSMRLFREEVFGPVLAVTAYDSLDEAVALANDSDYGLSGGVWSADARRALDVALRLRTGTVGINGAGLDVGAPFGGYKQSGVGRECGAAGLAEFFETKSVMGAASLA